MDKKLEDSRELITNILQYLNRSEEWIDIIRNILRLIQQFTRLDVIAIRLRDGEDYPYFAQLGFSDDFVRAENYLCERSYDERIARDPAGNAVLECMCGNIIRGYTTSSKPFFTEGGSFWTNSTTQILAVITEARRRECMRNPRYLCNRAGYESVALIPLRSGSDVFGLLQFNDRRKDCFNLEFIHFFEGVCLIIGAVLQCRQAEEMIREANEQLNRMAQIQKLAALGKLVGAVAHELRNPLSIIRNSIYFLSMKLSEAQDEKIKKHLEILDKEVSASDRIISDILSFGRIREPQLTRNNIGDIIKGVLEKIRVPENIEVDIELAANLPRLQTDASHLTQVFFNLILNAVQAMSSGGNLTISARLWKAEDNRQKEFIEVDIVDTGEGIPKENLSKIFEPFFSTRRDGTGLGLTVCQSIIEGHRGIVEVKSEAGKGTKFIIKLPITQAEGITRNER